MAKTTPLDKKRELLYKSFELHPLAKLATESGADATISVLNRLEYLANLTIPRDLSWLGHNRVVRAMDVDTMKFVRDHPTISSVARLVNEGTARQFGTKAPEESKVGAASAIALVQETEEGDIQVTRKKEIGLEDKHGEELIKEFHNIEVEEEKKPKEETALKVIEEELTPPLKSEVLPPVKFIAEKVEKKEEKKKKEEEYVMPWL